MFIGHYAAGLALKKADQSVSLGWLFLSATWLDLVWSTMLILGVEHAAIVPGITAANPLDLYDYPISHGLLAALGWSALAFLIFRFTPLLRNVNRSRAALVLAAAVFSHWILDFLSHAPDLPVTTGDSAKVGLGLWNHLVASYVVEILLFIAGLWLYLSSTRGRTFGGKYGILILSAVLLVSFLMNLVGPPPPDIRILAWVGFVMSLVMVAVGFWLDAKRQPR